MFLHNLWPEVISKEGDIWRWNILSMCITSKYDRLGTNSPFVFVGHGNLHLGTNLPFIFVVHEGLHPGTSSPFILLVTKGIEPHV